MAQFVAQSDYRRYELKAKFSFCKQTGMLDKANFNIMPFECYSHADLIDFITK
jgi:hypothetical protein